MPSLRQHVAADLAFRLEIGEVGGAEQHHLLALVAGLRQRLLGLGEVARASSAPPCRHRSPSACPGGKTPTPVRHSDLSGPPTASMKSAWLTASSTARRIAGLSKGGCRWLNRMIAIAPVVSLISTAICGFLRQDRQQVGQRLLPPVDLAALQGGGGRRRVGHRMPFDPVEMHDLGRRRCGRRAVAARHVVGEFLVDRAAAGLRAPSATKRNGPLPTISVICVKASVLRQPLRHDHGTKAVILASASGSSGKGCLQPEAQASCRRRPRARR